MPCGVTSNLTPERATERAFEPAWVIWPLFAYRRRDGELTQDLLYCPPIERKLSDEQSPSEVTPKQSEVIALAAEMGKLSLSLRSLVPSPTDEVEGDSSGNTGLGTHARQRGQPVFAQAVHPKGILGRELSHRIARKQHSG